MLLQKIDVSKSSGPDKLPGRLLQCLAKEITPVAHYIFTQSLCTGEPPTEWTQANVATVLKKGSRLQAVNYRPVSLTCITCKLFELIIMRVSWARDRGGLRLLGAPGWNLERGPISNEEESGKRIFWDYLRILFIPMWDIRPHILGLGPLNGGGPWL